jgi:hypothetical protein
METDKDWFKSKSLIYNIDGNIIETDEKINGKPFFCKYTCNSTELEIYKMIKNSPKCPFIVDIYKIDNRSVYMEKLSTFINSNIVLENDMLRAKDYLQSLGVCYIDWKIDNVGIAENGCYKLFDFDCSGIIDSFGKWKIKPEEMYRYKTAINHGLQQPLEIDNFSFIKIFLNKNRFDRCPKG